MKRDLLWVVLSFLMIVLGLCMVASFTVLPMMHNYRQCGTIFLCHQPR